MATEVQIDKTMQIGYLKVYQNIVLATNLMGKTKNLILISERKEMLNEIYTRASALCKGGIGIGENNGLYELFPRDFSSLTLYNETMIQAPKGGAKLNFELFQAMFAIIYTSKEIPDEDCINPRLVYTRYDLATYTVVSQNDIWNRFGNKEINKGLGQVILGHEKYLNKQELENRTEGGAYITTEAEKILEAIAVSHENGIRAKEILNSNPQRWNSTQVVKFTEKLPRISKLTDKEADKLNKGRKMNDLLIPAEGEMQVEAQTMGDNLTPEAREFVRIYGITLKPETEYVLQESDVDVDVLTAAIKGGRNAMSRYLEKREEILNSFNGITKGNNMAIFNDNLKDALEIDKQSVITMINDTKSIMMINDSVLMIQTWFSEIEQLMFTPREITLGTRIAEENIAEESDEDEQGNTQTENDVRALNPNAMTIETEDIIARQLREIRANPYAYKGVGPRGRPPTDIELKQKIETARIDKNFADKLDIEKLVYDRRHSITTIREADALKRFIENRKEAIMSKARTFADKDNPEGALTQEVIEKIMEGEINDLDSGPQKQLIRDKTQFIVGRIMQEAQYEMRHDTLVKDYKRVINSYDFDSDAGILKRKQKISILYDIKKQMENLKYVSQIELSLNEVITIPVKTLFPIKIFVTLPQTTKLSKDLVVTYSWTNNVNDINEDARMFSLETPIYEYKSPNYKNFTMRAKAYNRYIDKILKTVELKPKEQSVYPYYGSEQAYEKGGIVLKYISKTNNASVVEQETEMDKLVMARYKKLEENKEIEPNLKTKNELKYSSYLKKIKQMLKHEQGRDPILLKAYYIQNGETPLEFYSKFREMYPNFSYPMTKIDNMRAVGTDEDLLMQNIPFYLMLLKKLSLELWAMDNYKEILIKRKRNKFIKQDKLMIDTVARGI